MRPRERRRQPCHAIALLIAVGAAAMLAGQPVSAKRSADCSVAPRPASEFVMPTDPDLAGSFWLIVEDESELPKGAPATAADVADAQAFADLYTACQNAGDLRRISALSTDAMFRASLAARMYGRFPPANPLEALYEFLFDPIARFEAEEAALLAEDVAAPPNPRAAPIAVAEVRDVRVLPDGRLGAILVQDALPTEFQIYVHVDGRVLLDESIALRLNGIERSASTSE